jgi:predicted nucleotidyltransferase
MRQIILDKLSEIEKENKVRILLACESGSRAWGFPSPDSDYDVRFIYARSQNWYLTIREKPDVIEVPINAVLDINGWDIKKALHLISKHNSVLFEWLQSPIFYREENNFAADFLTVAQKSFSPIAAMHHYLSMSKKYFEECTLGENVKLKKYMYCLRTTLACLWISKNRTAPPMQLEKLLPLIATEKELLSKIDELVKLKSQKDESYLHPKESVLEKFLEKGIKECDDIALSLPASKYDVELLDDFFRSSIKLQS